MTWFALILLGQFAGGENVNVQNKVPVHVEPNGPSYSAFGDLRMTESHPDVFLTFPYSINPSIVNTQLDGGTVTHSRPFAVAQAYDGGTFMWEEMF